MDKSEHSFEERLTMRGLSSDLVLMVRGECDKVSPRHSKVHGIPAGGIQFLKFSGACFLGIK